MPKCVKKQKGRECVKQPPDGKFVPGRKLCTGCDKPGKDKQIGLKLHPCVRCGSWQTLNKDGVCAGCRLKEKLAKAKDCTCIMAGCDNKTKGNEPLCAKHLRESKRSPDPKTCEHPRAFGTPVFAQRLINPEENGDGVKCGGVACVMQRHACPDCGGYWYKPLPIQREDGTIYPEAAAKQSDREYQSFLAYGKEGGLRRETYSKLKEIWARQNRRVERAKR